MSSYIRVLEKSLPRKFSFFLLGPRQVGKTTIIKRLKPDFSVDFLNREVFIRYSKDPDILYRELSAMPKKSQLVSVDEVQKIPEILETVHRCMNELPHISFILSGSSARKLRRGGVNLLGGRALDYRIYPLSEEELGSDYLLENVLKYGSLPRIADLISSGEKNIAIKLLRSYVSTYLKEEIKDEALVQNLNYFHNFLEVSADYYASQINITELSAKAEISSHYVRKYFSILEDTLIGFFLKPYAGSERQRMSKQPKFYFFDNGVTRAIRGLASSEITSEEKGKLFEQWVVNEIKREIDYQQSELKMNFWRTKSGAEVDILLLRGSEIVLAIECKSNTIIERKSLSGLSAFSKTYPKVPLVLCAPVNMPQRLESGLDVLPPNRLLERIREI